MSQKTNSLMNALSVLLEKVGKRALEQGEQSLGSSFAKDSRWPRFSYSLYCAGGRGAAVRTGLGVGPADSQARLPPSCVPLDQTPHFPV